jgi:hypothetical protein
MHPSAAAGERHYGERPPSSSGEKGKYSSSGGGASQLSFGNYQLPSTHSGRHTGLAPVTNEHGKCKCVAVGLMGTST